MTLTIDCGSYIYKHTKGFNLCLLPEIDITLTSWGLYIQFGWLLWFVELGINTKNDDL